MYLKKDKVKKKLFKKLENNSSFLHYFAFSLISKILFRFSFLINFIKKFSFIKIIYFFKALGYNKLYAKYLIERERIPSYFISLILNQLIKNKKNYLILDFGGGFGHIAKKFPKKPLKIIIDKDFLSLYFNLNRKNKNFFYICYEFKKNIPIKNKSIDNFVFSDGFCNIKNQFLFLKEIKRIIKNNSSGYISQILSKKVKTFKEYNLSNPKTIEKYLKKLKFNNFKIIPSSIIWHNLKNKQILNLNKNFVLKNKRIYNIIIFPNKIKNLRIDLVFNLYKKTKINFYQDNDLLLDLKSDYKYE